MQGFNCKKGKKKENIWMGPYVARKPFSIGGAFPDVQDASSIYANAPSYHQRWRLLNSVLTTIWTLPFFFRLEDAVCIISKKSFKSVLAQSSRWGSFWIMSTCSFFFAWQSLDLHVWMLRWTVFTDSDSVSVPEPRDTQPKDLTHWYWFLTLTHRDVSRFSESFDITVYGWWNLL